MKRFILGSILFLLLASAVNAGEVLMASQSNYTYKVNTGFAYFNGKTSSDYAIYEQWPIIDYDKWIKFNAGTMHKVDNDGTYSDNFFILSFTVSLSKFIKWEKLSFADVGIYYPFASDASFPKSISVMVSLIEYKF